MSSGSLLVVERAISTVILGASFILVGRRIGPETFGDLVTVAALSQLLRVVATGGLDGILVDELGRKKVAAGDLVAAATQIRVRIYAIVVILAILSAAVTPTSITMGLAVSLLLQASRSAATVEAYLESECRFGTLAVARVTASASSASAMYAVALADGGVVALSAARNLEPLLVALLLWAFRPGRTQSELGSLRRALLARSWSVALSGLLVAFLLRADAAAVRALAGDLEAGLYGAAVRLTETFSVIGAAVGAALFPTVTNSTGQERLRNLANLNLVLVVCGIACTGVITLLGPTAVVALFGEEFRGARPVVRIAGLGVLGSFVRVGVSKTLIATGNEALSFPINLASAAIGAGLYLILIPPLGSVGAAAASSAAYLAGGIIVPLMFTPVRSSMAAAYRSRFTSVP